MVKSKHLSQDDNRLKVTKSDQTKMPPDAASRTIAQYSAQDSRSVIAETTYDSEFSDQDEPEKNSRSSEDVGQKSISSSLEDNTNGNGDKPFPTPTEDESLRSRTPSPVKKSRSFGARSKAVEEVWTTHVTTAPAESDGLNRDASRPGAAADSKPATSNDSSRGHPNDRDRVLHPNPAAGLVQAPAHAAVKSPDREKPRTRDSLPGIPRTAPQPTFTQRMTQAFYGKPSTHPDPRHYSNLERELKGLKIALGNKDSQIQQSETKRKELERKVKELEYSLAMAQEAYDDIVRKQQEEDFKQMDTGRWLPQEESKIKGDLDRLKRSMKSWSKDCSTNSMTPLQSLMEGTDEEVALIQCLSNVVRLDEGRLPPGLTTSKIPSLLLNALLAHDIYMAIFENPFFSLRDQLDYEPPRLAPDEKFNKIYHSMLAADSREAHIWRSQTLRLLYPPLRESSANAEVDLHNRIDAQIARVSEWHAERFVDGPARHLIHSDSEGQFVRRVKAIYKQAAELSYQLWARRTSIKCITLREMGPLAAFALDNPYMEPHTLVRYDDHSDHLFGKPFTVVVHPIVEAFGTDEGEGYDQKGRVWAKAVVWLDSRIDSRKL